jgi:hypothetical protein
MNEREQPVVDLGEAGDPVLISVTDFEGRQPDAASGKAVADSRFTDAVLSPESKADWTDWHGHCQLIRPWYARSVGGAAARVGRSFAHQLCYPALTERGREKAR